MLEAVKRESQARGADQLVGTQIQFRLEGVRVIQNNA